MTINIPSFGPSWVPKVGGLLGVFAAAVASAPDTAPGAAYIKPWLPAINALAVALVGFSARQNNKSSEQVGAGVIPPPPPQISGDKTPTAV